VAEKFLKQYQILYKKACVDLESARFLLHAIEKNSEALDIEVVFFHLQQAAEKFLKTLCSYKKVHVGKTHDISNLIEIIINNGIECPDYINEFGVLTQYAVEGRYAVIHDDYHDAGKFLELMKKFKMFTNNFLKIDTD
jgi:HEPN domain-containing protein